MKPLASTLAVLVFALSACAAPPEPSASLPATHALPAPWSETIAAGDARADLAALYDGLKSAHYDLFAHRAEDEYDAKYAETYARLAAPVSRFELYLALQEFTAYGNVAHARIDFPNEVYGHFRDNGGKAFPIYLRIVEGRAYVGEDYSGLAEIAPGDEILALDGAPMADWLARTAEYISADTPYIAHSLLEFLFPMYLWVERGEVAAFDLVVRSGDGSKRSVRVAALTRAEQEAAAEDPAGFTIETYAREARMLDGGVAYLRPGPFFNFEDENAVWDNTTFAAFIDEAFGSFLDADATSLVIDLRDNPGGDNSFSDLMISWIADDKFRFASTFKVRSSDEAAASNQARLDANPGAVGGVSGLYADSYATTPRGETFEFEIPYAYPREGARFEGDVFALINRHSYSNAVNTASIFQDYGWGEIAGEKTADMATTYGAMETFALPHSGFTVGFPKAHIIRPSGDQRTDGVTPDIVIASPVAPQPNDAVLDRLLEIIGAR